MKVLVAGGGIGGMSAALALRKVGHEVTVLEQADRISEVGAGIQIWANGPRVLRRLGLASLNEQLASPMEVQKVYTQSGKLLSTAPIAKIDEHCGEPSYFAHRAELLDGLLAAAKGVTICCDSEVAAYECRPDSVEVSLENGGRHSADVLIGADGIHSAVRKQMAPKAKVRYSGFVAWRGIAEYDEETWERLSPHWGVYLGKGSQRGVFPIANRRAYWFMTENRKQPVIDPTEREEYLLGTIKDWPDVFRETLEQTTSNVAGPIFDLSPFKGWSDERVVLLGDACHAIVPCLGQGACMAIEDAEVLSRVLGQSDSPAADFARYENLRFARTRRACRMARAFAKAMQIEAGWLIALRSRVLPLASRQDPIKAIGWLLEDVSAAV